MKPFRALTSLALLALLSAGCATRTTPRTDAEKLGWTLAVHSYSFRLFTIYDAIDKTAALGIKHMSISGSVLLSGTNPVTTVNLSDKDMEAIKAKMLSAGISWPFVNIGVVQLPPNEVAEPEGLRVCAQVANSHPRGRTGAGGAGRGGKVVQGVQYQGGHPRT